MSKLKAFFFIAFAICCFLTNIAFASSTHPRTACLVLDYNTGKILYEENPNLLVHPASLTKIMTLYLVFQKLQTNQLSLQQRFRVSSYAASKAPSKLGLKAGQYVSVEDLILGVVTRSANDAATVLAEGIGGSEPKFVAMMNQQASTLGMTHTTFYNASGLPNPKQYTTATDMALLSKALLHNQPRYYSYFNTRSFKFGGQLIASHNHLLNWYHGADGIKTGFVTASGFNLVASAMRNNRRLIGVIFGASSAKARDRHMASLLDRFFNLSAS
jgi:D-alanyl-D-alanine carboxypeptidase